MGHVAVSYDFVYDGGKPGASGTGTIFINGRKAASGRIDHTIPFIFGAETADVGVDLYTPVTADYKKGDNKFTGKINRVTIDLKKKNALTRQRKKRLKRKRPRTPSTSTESVCSTSIHGDRSLKASRLIQVMEQPDVNNRKLLSPKP